MLNIDEIGDVHSRIDQLVDHFCKGNKAAFGRGADIQSGVLAGIIGGRKNKPSFEVLQKLLTAYSSVNPTWLLFGRGPMLNSDTLYQSIQHSTVNQPNSEVEAIRSEVDRASFKLDAEREILEYLKREHLSIIAQRSDIEERRAQNQAKPDDFSRYQELVSNYYQAISREQSARSEVDASTAELVEIQRRYIDAIQPKHPTTSGMQSASYAAEANGSIQGGGGRLSQRLGISEKMASLLLGSGLIEATHVEGNDYQVTEDMVQNFLAKRKEQ